MSHSFSILTPTTTGMPESKLELVLELVCSDPAYVLLTLIIILLKTAATPTSHIFAQGHVDIQAPRKESQATWRSSS